MNIQKRMSKDGRNVPLFIRLTPAAYSDLRHALDLRAAMEGKGSSTTLWSRVSRAEWAAARAEAERRGFDWRAWLAQRMQGSPPKPAEYGPETDVKPPENAP